jgi:hypothetical protein
MVHSLELAIAEEEAPLLPPPQWMVHSLELTAEPSTTARAAEVALVACQHPSAVEVFGPRSVRVRMTPTPI